MLITLLEPYMVLLGHVSTNFLPLLLPHPLSLSPSYPSPPLSKLPYIYFPTTLHINILWTDIFQPSMVLTFISFLPCPPISLFEPFMAVSLFLTPSPITTNSYPLKYTAYHPLDIPFHHPITWFYPHLFSLFLHFLKTYSWTLSFHIFAPYPICVCKYIIAGIDIYCLTTF